MPLPIIALLTDFGLDDWFVGSMKAAILTHLPDCAIVDLCHTIEPGAVQQGAWLLARTFSDFPPATVFCAVVDPGVGTERRAIAAVGGGYFFVAPDNGLLMGARRCLGDWQCRAITNPAWKRGAVSRTFHGRDLFAPAAALVALEGGIEAAGEPIHDLVEIDLPATVLAQDGAVVGAVIRFDRFGNAITTIEQDQVGALAHGRTVCVAIGSLTIERLSSTFSDVAPGEVLAYWGSLGTLEIAMRAGSARERLGLALDDPVCLRPA
jgi:hypothetical protein